MNAIMNKTLHPFFIGFDRLLETNEQLSNSNYPPYNLIKVGESTYILELAVAGFLKSEIKVKLDKSKKILSVVGHSSAAEQDYDFIHKGIAARDFSKKFTIADSIEVSSVELDNGVLTIKLKAKEPEADSEQEFKIS